jgi:hypothetical protein
MGFFDALKRVLGGHAQGDQVPAPHGLARAWGLDDGAANAEGLAEASEYDRAQWLRKLKRILSGLPETRGEWPELIADAKALALDPAWIKECEREEFLLLVRRAVADRKFTEAEHRKLDLARDLIGLPEAEAEAALHSIVAEAESFFGKSVEGA